MMLDAIRRIARSAGLDLIRFSPEKSQAAQFSLLTKSLGVTVLFDVGANEGQFGTWVRSNGYRERLVSFEPLGDAHSRLSRVAAKRPPWDVPPPMAIGDSDGEIVLHVAGNSQSSSIRKMLPVHERAAPGSGYVGEETVMVRRLDQVGPEYLRTADVVMLKVDTQGFEMEVIRGAGAFLSRVSIVQLEVSFVPVYENALVVEEVVATMRGLGFACAGIWPAFADPTTGKVLQGDAVFVVDRALR